MFLLSKYNSFFIFLLIASFIPILTFFISKLLTPISNNNKGISISINNNNNNYYIASIIIYNILLLLIRFIASKLLLISLFNTKGILLSSLLNSSRMLIPFKILF